MKIACCLLIASPFLLAQSGSKRLVPVDAAELRRFEAQRKAGVAILVGIGKYPKYSGLGELHFPVRDVEELETELRKQNYATISLKDGEATKGSILNVVAHLKEFATAPQATVIFFFSGHGFEEGGGNYMATYEAAASDLTHTGLSVSALESALESSGMPRRVVWIDACRSEPTKSAAGRSFARFQAAVGTRILFSTKMGQSSYEDDRLRQSVFSYYLVRGLRGDAAGPDGLVTFRDLTDFVIDGVETWGVEHGHLQIPYEAGESRGDFLLANAGGAPRRAVEAPAPREAKAMETFENPKDGLKYVWIPPGAGAGFWLGQTEVTQEAFQRIMGSNPSHFQGNRLPAESVIWKEAADYCAKVGGRLPTEVEWEYVARAGGSDLPDLSAVAWYGANSGGRTHEVGQKLPNAWGVFDLFGNVWEWTSDWYDAGARERVLKGGAWNYFDRSGFRASARNREEPTRRYVNIGFRCTVER